MIPTNMSLVPVLGLVVVEDEAARIQREELDSLSKHEQVIALTEEIEFYRSKNTEGITLVSRLESEVLRRFKDETSYIEQLEEQIQKIVAEIESLDAEDEADDEEASDDPEFEIEDDLEEESDEAESVDDENSLRNTQIKLLYRRISTACHPDKTKNKALHEIFIAANTAHKAKDLDTLQALFDEMQAILKYGSRLMAKLMSKISQLKRELAQVKGEYSQLVESEDFKIAVKFFGSAQGKAHCLHVMASNITQKTYTLQNELKLLQAELDHRQGKGFTDEPEYAEIPTGFFPKFQPLENEEFVEDENGGEESELCKEETVPTNTVAHDESDVKKKDKKKKKGIREAVKEFFDSMFIS